MIQELLNRAMRNYEGANIVIRMKAKLFLLICLSILLFIPAVIGYSVYSQVSNPARGFQINYHVVIPEAASILLFALVFVLLVKGRFSLSSHLFLSLSLLTTWTIMFLDSGSAITRLDTIVFVIAIISLTPLAVVRRTSAILLYGTLNIAGLFLFVWYAKFQLEIPHHSYIDYSADSTVAMLIVTLTSYSVFIINRRALQQMESDLKVREHAERALLESQQRLADIINFLPDATFAVDLGRRVIIWNRGMETMTGIPASEILGKSGYAIPFYGRERPVLADYVLDRSEETRRLYSEIRQAGDTVTSEMFVPEIGSDGAYLWSTAKPLYGPEGDITGAIETIRDITERHRQESEKARLEEHLLHAQKMESVGRLAGGVAHDFNNLLTTIMGNTSLVMMELGAESPAGARLRDVMKAAESASVLTKQLLAFSRKQVIVPQPLDLNGQIERTAQMLARLIGEDIKPVMHLGTGVGPIMADPGQVEQIMINLVVNSRDAMPNGGTIIIETRPVLIDIPPKSATPIMKPGDYVALSVTDTGTGMPEEVLRHIFDPFFTTKPVGKGTGLGLASVYGAVRQNGGSIEVKSAPGQGTAMTIYFPAAGNVMPGGAPAAEAEALPRGVESVLLVEDDEKVCDFVAEILGSLGYRVSTAHNGTGALDIAGEPGVKIDLLLTDVILPDMTGPILAGQALKKHAGTRVLYMSGHAENVIVHHGIVDGGINFIAKPFAARDLAKKVREVLDGAA